MRTAFPFAVLLAVTACGDNGGNNPMSDASIDSSKDASVDAMPCVPAALRPVLGSLMTGELVIDPLQAEGVAELTVPLDRSILITSLRENESSPQHGGVQCILRDEDPVLMTPAGVRCRRNTPGTDTPGSTGEIRVRWTVATFTSGVTVQRGVANTGFTNPSVITLPTAADPAKSFVLLGGVAVGGGGWGSNEFQKARLLDATTLDIRTLVAGSETSYQVVTMTGATVQRGSAAMTTTETSTQATITGPGLVLATYNTDNASSIAAASLMLRATATNTAVQFSRSMPGTAIDIAWEVVRLPFFTQAFTTDFAAGTATKTQAIANLPAASSLAIASNQAVLGQATGSSAYAGADLDLLGEAALSITVTDGMVTLERGASSAAASVTWTVVDFSHDECATL